MVTLGGDNDDDESRPVPVPTPKYVHRHTFGYYVCPEHMACMCAHV